MEHGELLIEFTEAALGDNPVRLEKARLSVWETMGEAALVDVAACVGSYNSVVKVADASGIPLDEAEKLVADEINKELGLQD